MATNLSSIFKYISHYRLNGHQIGRKVGDMLEVLTMGALFKEEELQHRLHIEPKLYGFSSAGHKVEFVIFNQRRENADYISGGEIEDLTDVISFIECKKVGVEQTVNSKFKSAFAKHDTRSYRIPKGSEFEVNFAPRDLPAVEYTIHFERNNRIRITKSGSDDVFIERLGADRRIMFTYGVNGESEIIGNEASLREIDYELRLCKVLEIFSSTDDSYIGVLNDCLAGPQTPEKAKQASFVALDVRKKYTGSFDKRENESECISVLVLTEFSHWEEKSQNMIKACIDINMIVPDHIIVFAFERFEQVFGADGFLDNVNKDTFLNDPAVKELVLEIIEHFDDKIFKPIDDERLKSLKFRNGQIVFEA